MEQPAAIDRHRESDRRDLLVTIDNYVWVSEIRETLFLRPDFLDKYRTFMRLLRQSYQESSEDLHKMMDRLFSYEPG